MKLVPVIDLKGGEVVAARQGKRDRYAPLVSPLCDSSRADHLVDSLLRLYPFPTLYLADLEAIEGTGSQLEIIGAIRRSHPGLALWVDNGLQDLGELGRIARPVLGSESLRSLAQLAELRSLPAEPLLSLDFRGDRLLGPPGLDRQPELWPPEVILMTLERVGGDSGPDFSRLERLIASSPGSRLYPAGGIRGGQDLRRLRDLGAAGALVSSALHRGALDGREIRDLGCR